MTFKNRTRIAVGIVAVGAWWAGAVLARDYLDALEGHCWAPNSQWLAVNKPTGEELLFISVRTNLSYLVKPVGHFDLETINIFSSEMTTNEAPRKLVGLGRIIPSYGTSRLTIAEWSPDSKKAVYQIDPQQNGLFLVEEGLVVRRMPASEVPPWKQSVALQTSVEFVNGQTYRLRAGKRDGTTVKEVLFTDRREAAQVGLAELNKASFASANGSFLLYPRCTEPEWELVCDPLAAGAPRRSLPLQNAPPKDWELSTNDEYLAVLTTNRLLVGAIAAWDQARQIPFPSIQCDIEWSPDDHYLAYWTNGALYVLPRGSDQPVLVTKDCRSRLWGWRGCRLLFCKNRSKWGDVFGVEADKPDVILQLARAPHWPPYTPLKISVSPDGKQIVAVILEFDYDGRPTHQLWHARLGSDTEWEQIYDFGR